MQAVSEATTTIIIRESYIYELTQRVIQTVCLVKYKQLEILRIIY